MYYRGRGVEQDFTKAYIWGLILDNADAFDEEERMVFNHSIASHLTKEQIEYAKKYAAELGASIAKKQHKEPK